MSQKKIESWGKNTILNDIRTLALSEHMAAIVPLELGTFVLIPFLDDSLVKL